MTDPWEQATEKLIARTESNQIVWKAEHDFARHRSREREVVDPAYLAEVDGKTIAVYEFRIRRRDDHGNPPAFPDTNVAIEFVDENFVMEWPWPSPKGRYELLEAIQFQCSNAEEFLKHFLADSATA